ncbi:MAG: hypothetical protein BWY63_01559 [Chloroflexi bacterium ADurb.Bin360]|nr:MAG: hypothetical protein BWY63_01559 [Chloroflexi bacterium ADurb.Bin360]
MLLNQSALSLLNSLLNLLLLVTQALLLCLLRSYNLCELRMFRIEGGESNLHCVEFDLDLRPLRYASLGLRQPLLQAQLLRLGFR